MPRILAIDYGSKRIGLALSDETGTIASALPFVPADEKNKIIGLISDKEVGTVILGLPVGLSGEETKTAAAAREFGEWIGERARISVEYIDERFSTKEVLGEFAAMGKRASKNRGAVDSMVAQKMLMRYLETKK